MQQLLNIAVDLKHKNALDVLEDAELRNKLTQAIKIRQEIYQNDIEILLPRPMLLKWSLTFEKIDHKPCYFLFLENITKDELQVRNEFQRAHWETMMGLAAGIAHELGNPLNSITIHLKLLSQQMQALKIKDKSLNQTVKAITF